MTLTTAKTFQNSSIVYEYNLSIAVSGASVAPN